MDALAAQKNAQISKLTADHAAEINRVNTLNTEKSTLAMTNKGLEYEKGALVCKVEGLEEQVGKLKDDVKAGMVKLESYKRRVRDLANEF